MKEYMHALLRFFFFFFLFLKDFIYLLMRDTQRDRDTGTQAAVKAEITWKVWKKGVT